MIAAISVNIHTINIITTEIMHSEKATGAKKKQLNDCYPISNARIIKIKVERLYLLFKN